MKKWKPDVLACLNKFSISWLTVIFAVTLEIYNLGLVFHFVKLTTCYYTPLHLLQLLSGATFLGAIFCFTAFCIKSLYGFIALFAVGELFVFATQVISS